MHTLNVGSLTPAHVIENVTVSGTDSLGREFHGKLQSLYVAVRPDHRDITLGIRDANGGYRYVGFLWPFDKKVTVEFE